MCETEIYKYFVIFCFSFAIGMLFGSLIVNGDLREQNMLLKCEKLGLTQTECKELK